MLELATKHTIKIQLTILFSIIGALVYWTFNASAYVTKVDNHEIRINRVEQKLETIATKDDIKILKEDLKDYINKK